MPTVCMESTEKKKDGFHNLICKFNWCMYAYIAQNDLLQPMFFLFSNHTYLNAQTFWEIKFFSSFNFMHFKWVLTADA